MTWLIGLLVDPVTVNTTMGQLTSLTSISVVGNNFSPFVTREGFSDWRNSIVIFTACQDSMLTYLTRRQGLGLGQQLAKQIQEE